MPYVLQKFKRFAVNVWDVGLVGKTDEQVASEGLSAMKTWMKELGLAMNITELGAKEDMFIKASGKLSVNIVDEGMLSEADYVGSLSGAKADKSKVFEYELGEAGTPIVCKAPLTMECSVVDIYNTPGFESFICSMDNTYVEEKYLNDAGKINYNTLKLVLFEFPTYAISLTNRKLENWKPILIRKCLYYPRSGKENDVRSATVRIVNFGCYPLLISNLLVFCFLVK